MTPPLTSLGQRSRAAVLVGGVAKRFELRAHAIREATTQWVSGHSPEHLVAALPALRVIVTWRSAGAEHNRAEPPLTAA